MSKLTYENKINLYNDRKAGMTVLSVAKKYNITVNGVNYLVRLINKQGLSPVNYRLQSSN